MLNYLVPEQPATDQSPHAKSQAVLTEISPLLLPVFLKLTRLLQPPPAVPWPLRDSPQFLINFWHGLVVPVAPSLASISSFHHHVLRSVFLEPTWSESTQSLPSWTCSVSSVLSEGQNVCSLQAWLVFHLYRHHIFSIHFALIDSEFGSVPLLFGIVLQWTRK